MQGAQEVLESNIEKIESKLLSLDQQSDCDGSYLTIICKPDFGTRAIDYRSTEGLNLIVATSLPNEREVQQTFGRVKRFGDKGKIFVFGPLIDSQI